MGADPFTLVLLLLPTTHPFLQVPPSTCTLPPPPAPAPLSSSCTSPSPCSQGFDMLESGEGGRGCSVHGVEGVCVYSMVCSYAGGRHLGTCR